MELDRYELEFEAVVDMDTSTFEGRSAGIGNLDSGDDVIESGAFKKTIRERLKRGDVKLIDGHNARSTTNVWGKAIEAEEQPFQPLPGKQPQGDPPTHVLWSKFFVTRAEAAAQAALRKIEEKVLNALSIGYAPVKVEYEPKDSDSFADDQDPVWEWYMGRAKRLIKELKWMETSLVTWGMNAFAEILPGTVKQLVHSAQVATADGRVVPPTQVKQVVHALDVLLQGDEERIRAELKGEVPLLVPVLFDINIPEGGKQADGLVPDPTDKAAAAALEAATKTDTHEPGPDATGTTPAPSDEGHFPSPEQLADHLAALEVLEGQLTT